MNPSSFPKVSVRNIDKVVHTIMFLGLAGVIFFDSTRYLRVPISNKRLFLGVFLFPALLGGLIEILQGALTTTRSADWFDFLFDVIGALLGVGIALLINRYFLEKKKA
jgi:VanZ family protein